MLGELWAWLTNPANSSVIQAFSAIASVLLTLGLVVFAGVQSWKMEGQRAEMVRAREAAVKPYLHVTGARIIGSTVLPNLTLGPFYPQLDDFVVTITVRNVGTGPALSIRGDIKQDRFKCWRFGYMEETVLENRFGGKSANKRLVRSTSPGILQSSSNEMELCFRLVPKEGVQRDQKLQITEGRLWIEYRDLLEKAHRYT